MFGLDSSNFNTRGMYRSKSTSNIQHNTNLASKLDSKTNEILKQNNAQIVSTSLPFSKKKLKNQRNYISTSQHHSVVRQTIPWNKDTAFDKDLAQQQFSSKLNRSTSRSHRNSSHQIMSFQNKSPMRNRSAHK